MTKASVQLMSRPWLAVGQAMAWRVRVKYANESSAAVTSRHTPTTVRLPSNSAEISFLKNTPTMPTGMHDSSILQT